MLEAVELVEFTRMETCYYGFSEDEGKIHAGKTQNISSLLGPNQTKKALRSTENTET